VSTLLDADGLRLHVETDLTDPALEQLIADADADIVNRFGPHATDGEITVTLRGGYRELLPTRPIAQVTTVTEYTGSENVAEVATVLAADDYRIDRNGFELTRLGGGTNPRSTWGFRVTLLYHPVNDDDVRRRVMIDLCKLAIQFQGLASERVGAYGASLGDYEGQRSQILRRLQRIPAVA